MNRKSLIVAAAWLAVCTGAYAGGTVDPNTAAQKDPKAFTIDPSSVKVEITPVDFSSTPMAKTYKMNAPILPSKGMGDVLNGAGDVIGTIDQIVNLYQKIWSIIEENKPVVNINTQFAAAIPQGITSWTQLAGWQGPKSYQYHISAKNLYGITTIDVTYLVVYSYGGNYNGHGKFLTGVSVQPVNVDVLWGYTFAMSASVPDSSIVNAGTQTDPVAAMQLVIDTTISTVLKSSGNNSVIYLRGDGYFQDLSSYSKSAAYKAPDLSSLQALQ
jgi:hypothetical protein